jgi:hypothetical protein
MALMGVALLTAASVCPLNKPLPDMSDDELAQCWIDGKLGPFQTEMDNYARQLEKNLALSQTDRASLLPYLDRACRNYVLANRQFIALLSLDGISVDEVCRCQGPLFISGLSDAHVRVLARDGLGAATTAFMNTPFVQAAHNCGLSLTASHNRELFYGGARR